MSEYVLLIADRDAKRVRNLTKLMREIRWTTQRSGAPGILEFDLIKGENASYLEGDRVQFFADGKLQFTGFVFIKEKNHKNEIRTLCYDQLRYLKARQSYVFSGCTATAVIAKIAADFGLRAGTLADSRFVIPSLLVDDKSCLDTICTALTLTAAGGAGDYVFYDSGGALTLTAAADMRLSYVLGDRSLAGSYLYRTSIDDEVYNYVKLLRPDTDVGKGDVYVAKSDDTIKRWGLLQYYERVDEELNGAQIQEQAKNLLLSYNGLQRRLHLEAVGIPGLRAGNSMKVQIENLGDISLSQWLMADKVVHTFGPVSHRMALDFSIRTAADSQFSIAYDSFQENIPAKASSSGGSSGGSKSKSGSVAAGSGGYKYPHHNGFRISTPFGKKGKSWAAGYHTGTDYVGTGSKKIYAVATGKVVLAGWNGAYGKSVRIFHEDGYISLYGHLSAIRVTVGDKVGNGTVIGVEGSTGNASGSHLHLEIHKGSYHYPAFINPDAHIKSRLKA